MSTRSCIMLQRKNGMKEGIYCHFDGYITHNGVILQMCYDSLEKVEKLLKLGDLSCLGEYVDDEEKEKYGAQTTSEVCVAYHRDCGEELMHTNQRQEYNYIYDEKLGIWFVESGWFGNEILNRGKSVLPMKLFDMVDKDAHLLIDEIIKEQKSCQEAWKDNEFATKENMIQIMIDKARKQVKKENI